MTEPAQGTGLEPNGRAGDPERWHEVSTKDPCPVCRKTSWCRVSADGEAVACRRESQGGEQKSYGDGSVYYLHLRQSTAPKPPEHEPRPPRPGAGPERAGVETLHSVYQALLERLSLSAPHRAALATRGLSPEEIDRRGYRSLPTFGRAKLLSGLVERFGRETLLCVPGFFQDGLGELQLSSLPGLLVPVRNEQAQVVALKVRPDRPLQGGKYLYLSSANRKGPGPGAPPHVPLGVVFPARLVRLTDGELKADAATYLSGLPTISIASVSSWRSALAVVRALGCETVRLAFDAEVNENVASCLCDCAGMLEVQGFALELERWDATQGKGIDEVLRAGPAAVRVFTGADVMLEIRRLAAAAGVKEPSRAGHPPAPGRELRPNEAPEDPHRLARSFRDAVCMHKDGGTLRYWRDEWRRWEDSAYRPMTEREFRAELTAFAKTELDRVNIQALDAYQGEGNGKGRRLPPRVHQVTTQLVSNTMQALTGDTVLKSRIDPPVWLDTEARFPVDEILPARNALVHLPSVVAEKSCTVPPTPAFFSLWSLDYDFDPHAPPPKEWLRFLRSLWPEDEESISTLQEWFGYHLIPDTRYQKILMFIGPKRAGKGTISRVLSAVIGPENVAAPTLAGLATNFGLAPLIGKQAAIISDARLSGQSDSAVVVERLLSISGEDAITIDRKHQAAWTGKLAVRFTLLSNELPRLKDASGALASRFLLLRLTHTFLNREDQGLFQRLHAERSGILLWAIEGWRGLNERGRFIQPQSGRELIEEMENLGSPVLAFMRERCRLGPECEVATKDLYDAWCAWCALKGKRHPGDSQNFGRELRAAVPGLKTTLTRRGREQVRFYQGVELIEEPF